VGGDQLLTAPVQPAAWDLVRSSLQGELLLPRGDGRYDKARQVYYSQCDVISPKAGALLRECHGRHGLPGVLP
jgi:hypothetical protein